MARMYPDTGWYGFLAKLKRIKFKPKTLIEIWIAVGLMSTVILQAISIYLILKGG